MKSIFRTELLTYLRTTNYYYTTTLTNYTKLNFGGILF